MSNPTLTPETVAEALNAERYSVLAHHNRIPIQAHSTAAREDVVVATDFDTLAALCRRQHAALSELYEWANVASEIIPYIVRHKASKVVKLMPPQGKSND